MADEQAQMEPPQAQEGDAPPPQGDDRNWRGSGMDVRPGDWACPACNFNNFASRTECHKCHAPRPDGGGAAYGGGYGGGGYGTMDYGGGFGGRGGGGYGGGFGGGRFGGGGGGNRRPGDWTCPGCGANVFASKSACFRCQTPKPEGMDAGYGGGGYGGGGYGGGFGGGGGGGGNRRPGDWACPGCGANVFASKLNCFRCQTPKPEGAGADGGYGAPPYGGGYGAQGGQYGGGQAYY